MIMAFTYEDKNAMAQCYITANFNAPAASRIFTELYGKTVSTCYLRKVCVEEYKLPVAKHGGKRIALNGGRGALTAEEEQRVIKALKKHKNILEAAKKTGFSTTVFYRIKDKLENRL